MKPVLTGLTAIALVGMLANSASAVGMHDRKPMTGLGDTDMRAGPIDRSLCDPVVNGSNQPATTTTGHVVHQAGTHPCMIKAAASTSAQPITIDSDLAFDFDKSVIRPSYAPKLDDIAARLMANPGMTLRIEGYTDSTGTTAYNQKLSERRAKAVIDYLSRQGVPATAMTMEAMGETHPIASNATADGRARNRRTEIHGAVAIMPTAAATPSPALSEPKVADGTIIGLDFGNRLVKLDGNRTFGVPDLAMMDGLKTGNAAIVHYRSDGSRNLASSIFQPEHEAQS